MHSGNRQLHFVPAPGRWIGCGDRRAAVPSGKSFSAGRRGDGFADGGPDAASRGEGSPDKSENAGDTASGSGGGLRVPLVPSSYLLSSLIFIPRPMVISCF